MPKIEKMVVWVVRNKAGEVISIIDQHSKATFYDCKRSNADNIVDVMRRITNVPPESDAGEGIQAVTTDMRPAGRRVRVDDRGTEVPREVEGAKAH